MDPWKPKYKPLYDFIENVIGVAELVAIWAVLLAIVIITL